MRRHREKTAIYQPTEMLRADPSPQLRRNPCADTLTSHLGPQNSPAVTFYCFCHHLGYFVTAPHWVRDSCFKIFFFLMWIIFKVFTEFVTILLPFCVWFFGPGHMWDLRPPPPPPTRDQTHTPGIGRQSLNHWATREVTQGTF